jgi:hypothetical protein
MGRVLNRMNIFPLLIGVIQEPSQKDSVGPIVALTILLSFIGILFLVFKTPPEDQQKKVDDEKSFNVVPTWGAAFEGCFTILFVGAAFVALIAVCLFVIVKAVKFVWFF